ncbi:hypothetical protein TWF225_004026 [Orbilia oligospora]|nr:hypothetical protein TWF225_004026 [Orbilia oligospora]KAF3251243.1 hypothetical protein TWF128_007253 [Orbilia oligospora]KAF3286428.1 hypothetical protein TWF132_008858 [Orbilia oligospora]
MSRHTAGDRILSNHVHLAVKTCRWLRVLETGEESENSLRSSFNFFLTCGVHEVVNNGEKKGKPRYRTHLLYCHSWECAGGDITKPVSFMSVSNGLGFEMIIFINPLAVF